MVAPTLNLVQPNFRFRTVNVDSAGENAAFDASDPALNTDISWYTDVPLRMRHEVEETAGGSTTYQGQIQYSHNGGSYVDMTTSTTEMQVTGTAGYVDDAATTDVISGSGLTFQAGYVDDSNGTTSGVNLRFRHTEFEHCFKIIGTAVSGGDTLDVRMKGMNSWTNIGRITVIKETCQVWED